ncbi:MAG: OmpA family protein [Acidobacteria bacterium]|nr:OmpA family protein [Acidobacteriota bacterium]
MRTLLLFAAACVLTGCATKRYVRETVAPVNQKTSDLDKRSAENATAVQALDDKTQRNISRVDEKAGAAEARANEAARLAGQAGTQAAQAGEKAEAARALAEGGVARAGKLEKVVADLDKFRLASTTKVFFAFNQSNLNDDGKKDLDALARSLPPRYVLEVQGFSDSVGDADYNYALSEKRAAAVVRYLTTQHKVPVYRISTLGLGKEMPAVGGDPREIRKLSRRVEVKLYTPAE